MVYGDGERGDFFPRVRGRQGVDVDGINDPTALEHAPDGNDAGVIQCGHGMFVDRPGGNGRERSPCGGRRRSLGTSGGGKCPEREKEKGPHRV